MCASSQAATHKLFPALAHTLGQLERVQHDARDWQGAETSLLLLRCGVLTTAGARGAANNQGLNTGGAVCQHLPTRRASATEPTQRRAEPLHLPKQVHFAAPEAAMHHGVHAHRSECVIGGLWHLFTHTTEDNIKEPTLCKNRNKRAGQRRKCFRLYIMRSRLVRSEVRRAHRAVSVPQQGMGGPCSRVQQQKRATRTARRDSYMSITSASHGAHQDALRKSCIPKQESQ